MYKAVAKIKTNNWRCVGQGIILSNAGRYTEHSFLRLVGIIYWVPAWALWNIYFTDVQVILAIQIQIQRKSKRKTKTKTQRVKQPTGGRFAPPSQVPPLAFLFSFSFWFTLNLNFPHPPAPVPRREKKNHEKNEVWLKWKFRSWRSILSKNHQNRSYPRVFLATLKFAHLFSRCAWGCLIYF